MVGVTEETSRVIMEGKGEPTGKVGGPRRKNCHLPNFPQSDDDGPLTLGTPGFVSRPPSGNPKVTVGTKLGNYTGYREKVVRGHEGEDVTVLPR